MALMHYEAVAQFNAEANVWCVSTIGVYIQVENKDDIEAEVRAELTRINNWVVDTTSIVDITIVYITTDTSKLDALDQSVDTTIE